MWCSVEDAASEVERKAMTVDGGGRATERLQRSIDELRRVRSRVLDNLDSAMISRPRKDLMFTLHACRQVWLCEGIGHTY